eukprot:m.101699 g.101699  ORF g.101699 m.101699 type:complete len:530 (+) comp13754_c0_seq1:183-1772(+)
MATGDLDNNFKILQGLLRKSKYAGGIDLQSVRNGSPQVFLPLIHFAVLGYSQLVANFIISHGYELYGKSDLRFIEGVYKLLRDEFYFSPKITKAQFFGSGFAEQKAILTSQIFKMMMKKHSELQKRSRLESPLRKKLAPVPIEANTAKLKQQELTENHLYAKEHNIQQQLPRKRHNESKQPILSTQNNTDQPMFQTTAHSLADNFNIPPMVAQTFVPEEVPVSWNHLKPEMLPKTTESQYVDSEISDDLQENFDIPLDVNSDEEEEQDYKFSKESYTIETPYQPAEYSSDRIHASIEVEPSVSKIQGQTNQSSPNDTTSIFHKLDHIASCMASLTRRIENIETKGRANPAHAAAERETLISPQEQDNVRMLSLSKIDYGVSELKTMILNLQKTTENIEARMNSIELRLPEPGLSARVVVLESKIMRMENTTPKDQPPDREAFYPNNHSMFNLNDHNRGVFQNQHHNLSGTGVHTLIDSLDEDYKPPVIKDGPLSPHGERVHTPPPTSDPSSFRPPSTSSPRQPKSRIFP